MGCLNGNTLDCTTGNAGGIVAAKIIPYEAVTGWTVDAPNDGYSAHIRAVGESWQVYQFDPDEAAQLKEKFNGSKYAETWEQTFDISLGKRSVAARKAIMEFAACGCGVIVALQDGNGKIWIVGDNAVAKAYLSANDGDTGGHVNEPSKETLQVKVGLARYKAKPYSGTWASLA